MNQLKFVFPLMNRLVHPNRLIIPRKNFVYFIVTFRENRVFEIGDRAFLAFKINYWYLRFTEIIALKYWNILSMWRKSSLKSLGCGELSEFFIIDFPIGWWELAARRRDVCGILTASRHRTLPPNEYGLKKSRYYYVRTMCVWYSHEKGFDRLSVYETAAAAVHVITSPVNDLGQLSARCVSRTRRLVTPVRAGGGHSN